MRYNTYLFDFDLTLADSSRGIVKCFSIVLSANGYQPDETAIKRTIGRTLEESFSILSGIKDDARLAELKKQYTAQADIYMNDLTVLYPETAEALRNLKAKGVQIAIISTKYRFRIEDVINRHLPKDTIDLVIGGEDVTEMKPSPQGVQLAMKRLQANKEHTLYIGDSVIDAETAQRAGLSFCGVLTGLTTRAELEAYPHVAVVENLSLLPTE